MEKWPDLSVVLCGTMPIIGLSTGLAQTVAPATALPASSVTVPFIDPMSAPAIKLLIAPTATTSEIRHIQRVSTGIVPQSKPGTEGQCSENAGDDLECRYLQPTPLPSGHVQRVSTGIVPQSK